MFLLVSSSSADQLLQRPHENSALGGHDHVVVVVVTHIVDGPGPLPGDLHQQRAAEHHPPTAGHLRPRMRPHPAGATQLRPDGPPRVRRIRRRQALKKKKQQQQHPTRCLSFIALRSKWRFTAVFY